MKGHRLRMAVLLAVGLVALGLAAGPQALRASAASPAPQLQDWGWFDAEEDKEHSLADDNTLHRDAAGTTLYLRYDHNVAGEHLQANNLPKVHVIANDGTSVAAEVWVKPTATEFQYRQYIFITLSENLDPDMGYQILVDPGIQANNTYADEEGEALFFAYRGTSGLAPDQPMSGEEPAQTPEEALDPGKETGKARPTAEKRKDRQGPAGSGAGTGSYRTGAAGTGASRPAAAGTAGSTRSTGTPGITGTTAETAARGEGPDARRLSGAVASALRAGTSIDLVQGRRASGEDAGGALQGRQTEDAGNPHIVWVGLLSLALSGAGAGAQEVAYRRRAHRTADRHRKGRTPRERSTAA